MSATPMLVTPAHTEAHAGKPLYQSPIITLTAGKLVTVAIMHEAPTGVSAPTLTSLSGLGTTWSRVPLPDNAQGVWFGGGARDHLAVLEGVPVEAATGQLEAIFGSNVVRTSWLIVEWDGATGNVVAARWNRLAPGTNGIALDVAMPEAASQDNTVFGFLGLSANIANVSEPGKVELVHFNPGGARTLTGAYATAPLNSVGWGWVGNSGAGAIAIEVAADAADPDVHQFRLTVTDALGRSSSAVVTATRLPG